MLYLQMQINSVNYLVYSLMIWYVVWNLVDDMFSVEFDHMLISVESKETINSVDNPYVLICEAIY